MKGTAQASGVIEQGFKRADDGWHVVKFDEGIDYLKNKEGEISVTKSGDNRWKFPLVVEDENDDNNGVKIDFITQENDKGENMIAGFLLTVGLLAAFEKNFPGDVSLFEDKVMQKIKVKMPGQFMRIKTKQSPNKKDPDNPYVNIIAWGPMSSSVEKLEAELFGDKKTGGTKKEKVKKEAAPIDDDF